MNRQQLREEIRMLHFPSMNGDQLPDGLLNMLIDKAYSEIVTRQHTNSVTAPITLSGGSYDLSGLTGFYEPRWYDYEGTKLVEMQIENVYKIPTDVTMNNKGQKIYYMVDKTITVLGGTTESINVTYWSYPTAITADVTEFTALEDQFSDAIVDRVCWKIAQGKEPNRVKAYIAGYNEHLRNIKQYYIKKYQAVRGYTVPMDF